MSVIYAILSISIKPYRYGVKMEVTKRNGTKENFDSNKISRAIYKSFVATDTSIEDADLNALVVIVVNEVQLTGATSVEQIQDIVEKALMQSDYFDQAKAYILYRSRQQELRRARKSIVSLVGIDDINQVLKGIQKDFNQDIYSLVMLEAKLHAFVKNGMDKQERLASLVRAANELTSTEATKWAYVAARITSFSYHEQIDEINTSHGIEDRRAHV